MAAPDPVTAPDPIEGLERSRELAVTAARAASAKKAQDTVVLEVWPVLGITDMFVIASGSNPRQVRTIVEEVESRVKATGGPPPIRIEGLDDAAWVLVDFGDFVVHVLLEEARSYYDLERLWADVERVEWAEEDGSAAGSAQA